jgi:hypothetical protein
MYARTITLAASERCVNTASLAQSAPDSTVPHGGQRFALPRHFNPVSSSGRACQGQPEHCVNTPKPDTVLNTESESVGCNFGSETLPELYNDCATLGLQSALWLIYFLCLFKWLLEMELNRRHADFQDLA